jgi:hypothetical protein
MGRTYLLQGEGHIKAPQICKFKKKGYQHDILQCSAGLVVNPSTVDHYVYLFGCTVAGV